jgi:multidrug efflux pump subunit AcrA (membrane-fusion protein)
MLAPFGGTVQVTAQVGQRVSRGDALGRLTATGPLRAAFAVAEMDVRKVAVGAPAEVRVVAFPDREFTGQVAELSPVVDPSSGTVGASVEIKGPTEGLLPGMTATVTLKGAVQPAAPAK